MRVAKRRCQERLQEYFENENEPDFITDGVTWTTLSYLGKGLHLQLSTIPNAGYGLFTNRSFVEHDVICEYAGTISNQKSSSSRYMAYLTPELYIDGFDQKALCYNRFRNPGSMINDSREKYKNNCRLYLVKQTDIPFGNNENKNTHLSKFRLFVVAITAINAKEELFLSYGAKYWNVYGND